MSAIRPDMNAGPMLRISRPLNVPSLNPGSDFSSSCAKAVAKIARLNIAMALIILMTIPF